MESKLKLKKDEKGMGMVSRFMEKPISMHMQSVKHILGYVKGKLDFVLTCNKGDNENVITGYTEIDLAKDVNDRRTTAGMAYYLNENLVTWCSQNQQTFALSSCEAEFMVIAIVAFQGKWIRHMIHALTGVLSDLVVLHIDNKSALKLMKNPITLCFGLIFLEEYKY
ncbi:hypothetical protein Lser_V15G06776 [Lactuca serriola]